MTITCQLSAAVVPPIGAPAPSAVPPRLPSSDLLHLKASVASRGGALVN